MSQLSLDVRISDEEKSSNAAKFEWLMLVNFRNCINTALYIRQGSKDKKLISNSCC